MNSYESYYSSESVVEHNIWDFKCIKCDNNNRIYFIGDFNVIIGHIFKIEQDTNDLKS